MADENEVVDFCAVADACFANSGTVDAGVGLDFHVVFEDGGAGLDNFVPGAVFAFREAEAVGSDDGAVLENDAIADAAKFADDGVRMREEIVADADAAIEGDGTVEHGVLADDDVFINETVRADVSVGADFCGSGDDRSGMHARRVLWRLVKKFEGAGEGKIGIVAANEGERRCCEIAGEGKIVFDEDGGGAGGFEQGSVAFVGEKSDLTGLGFFEAGHGGDFEFGGRIEAAIELLGKVRQLHGRGSSVGARRE